MRLARDGLRTARSQRLALEMHEDEVRLGGVSCARGDMPGNNG